MRMPLYIYVNFAFIIGIIIFVTIDLIKSKSATITSNISSNPKEVSEQEGKGLGILRGVFVLILQFLLLFFAVGRHSFKIFLAIELAVIPIILLHNFFIFKNQNINLYKMNSLSKIGGLIAYLYCKFLLFLVFKAITNSVIYYGGGVLLIIILEALSIYIAISHLIIGVNRKTYSNILHGDKYSDLSFLFTEAKMKAVVITGSVGVFLRLVAYSMPYIIRPGINIIADLLIVVFMESCLLKIKKWSFVKVALFIALVASITSIMGSLIIASPELSYRFSRAYLNVFLNLSYVSVLLYIVFPVGLIISKPKVLIVTITSYITAGYGIFVLVMTLKTHFLSTYIYILEELLFLLVFLSILFLKDTSKKKNILLDSSL